MKILLTHSPEAMKLYYGPRALAGLQQLGEVVLHKGSASLEGEALIQAAQDCDLIVSYRQSPGPAELFERLPGLKAFLRCAIDIRNVDVAAASKAGVLVTQASAGFVTSVSELVLGFMVDLARGVNPATHLYHHNRVPPARMGRELKGSALGVIGYGAIGKEVVRVAKALGMRVLINDPYVSDVETVASTSRAATWSTRTRSRRRSSRAISAAARWMSAARPTRCRRCASRRGPT